MVEQRQHVFESLCHYFDEHENEVIEIEILPSTSEPQVGLFLQDGSSLGIPKKALVAAFLEARQVFFDSRGNGPTNPKVHRLVPGGVLGGSSLKFSADLLTHPSGLPSD